MEDKSLTTPTQAAKEYMQSAHSPNTKRAYKADWQHIETWAREQGVTKLPFGPGFVCAYIAHLAQSGYKVATIRRRLTTIGKVHTLMGHENPIADPKVKTVFSGIRKQHGAKQTRKTPLTSDLIKQWIDTLDDSLKSNRDKALVLVGYAGALRRSEIAAIQFEDLRFEPEGVVIFIPQSKTDTDKSGDLVAIPYGSNSYCPVRSLQAWIKAARIKDGFVFRGFWKGNQKIRKTGITGKAVSIIVKQLCEDIGLDPSECGGHSLRAGLATEAKRKGAPDQHVMQHGRWKSRSSFDRYVREGNLFRHNPAKLLDL